MFIYLPNLLLLLTWIFFVQFNIFFCVILTPISYIAINGGLIYYKQFNNAHYILDQTIVLPFIENIIKTVVLFIVGKINQISCVNKFYLFLKVKLLVYVFNIIANVIPKEKSNDLTDGLTNDLKNDYMEILNKNRKRREIKLE